MGRRASRARARALAATILAAATLAMACATVRSFGFDGGGELGALATSPAPAYPEAKFMVMSDLHAYDPALGTEGMAFEAYLAGDRKLLKDSAEILDQAIGRILAEKPAFVLVSGDLTKDGEKACHELVARKFAELRAAGIAVYVVPGNHDIQNPHARRFTGDTSERVENIGPADFASIYADCGYASALERDPASLSYLAEPVPGLRLLAIDSCDYSKNSGASEPETAGRFSPERLAWIEAALARCAREGKAVIAMEHHGAWPHYASQAKYYPQYVVEGYADLSRLLSAYNAKIVFTGHFHAQDIVRAGTVKPLYDVETGSLVTYPNPLRTVRLSAAGAEIRSQFIATLPSYDARGVAFGDYALAFVKSGIESIAKGVFDKYGVSEADQKDLLPQVSAAIMAHYRGDEKFAGAAMLKEEGLGFMGWVVVQDRKALIHDIWNDPPPADNDIRIDAEGMASALD